MPAPAQPNTSATGGPLQPAPVPTYLEDKALENFFQSLVAVLANLSSTLVFPRWQEEPPNLPAYGVNWAAVGIVASEPDRYAWVGNNGGINSQLQRHEQLELMASFYGPGARGIAQLFSNNLQIPQNREILRTQAMGFTSSGKLTQVPSLIKARWTTRVDLPFRIKRGMKMTYPILSVLEFQASVTKDVNGQSWTETVTAGPQPPKEPIV